MWQLECWCSSLFQSCIGVIQGCWMANTTLMTSYLFTLLARRCRARAGSSKCEQHAFFGSFGNTTVKEIKLRELKDLLTDSPSVVVALWDCMGVPWVMPLLACMVLCAPSSYSLPCVLM